jgi:hypothetical protein
MKKLILLGFLALTTMGSVGCASYAGVATSADGTIYGNFSKSSGGNLTSPVRRS